MRKRTYWTTDTFANKINEMNPQIKVVGEYVNMHTKIKCVCMVDGHIWHTTPTHLLHSGRGCPKCNGGVRKTHDEFIEQIKKINKDIIVLGKYISDRQKIKLKCKTCKSEWETKPTHIIQGHGCPHCRESMGEKEIAKYLDSIGIKYIRQKRFKDCKDKYTLPFDFYIPSLNICIEYDGEQHFRENPVWSDRNSLKDTQRRDRIKTNYCKSKGIKLIRASYRVKDVRKYIIEKMLSA